MNTGICDLVGNAAEIVYGIRDGSPNIVGGSYADDDNIVDVSQLNRVYDWGDKQH